MGGTRFTLGLGGFTFRATAFRAFTQFPFCLRLPLLFRAFTLFALGLRLPLLLSALPFSLSSAFTLARKALSFKTLPFPLSAPMPFNKFPPPLFSADTFRAISQVLFQSGALYMFRFSLGMRAAAEFMLARYSLIFRTVFRFSVRAIRASITGALPSFTLSILAFLTRLLLMIPIFLSNFVL